MGTSLRVLVIESSEEDTELLCRELRRCYDNAQIERVKSAATLQPILAQKSWDILAPIEICATGLGWQALKRPSIAATYHRN